MNKTKIEYRRVFLRMHKLGKSAKEIAAVTGIKLRNIYNWKKLTEEELLREPDKNTRKPTFDIKKLQEHFEAHPFDFNKEIGLIFSKNKNTIQKWRHKLGFKRKKAKTTYKESDENLKKTFK
jgi:transposase